MNALPENPPPSAGRSAWPRVFLILGLAAFAGLFGVFLLLRKVPADTLKNGAKLVTTLGQQATSVAEGFRRGTVRQEFTSHAAGLNGTSFFQFATLHQEETFRREEASSAFWGLIALPKIVVQAEVPVDYSYFLDFQGTWEFRREDQIVWVKAPAIQANPPAVDISAVKFFALGGSVWRDDGEVRERLRSTLSASLQTRAQENIPLVREIGRQRLVEFTKTWLAEKFHDGREFEVKVTFPDETPAAGPTQKP